MKRPGITPTELVVGAVALVIERRWHELRNSEELHQANPEALRRALTYLSKFDFEVKESEPPREEYVDNKENATKQHRPREYSLFEKVEAAVSRFLVENSAELFLLMALSVCLGLIVVLIKNPYVVAQILTALAQALFYIAPYVLIALVVIPIFFWLVRKAAESSVGKSFMKSSFFPLLCELLLVLMMIGFFVPILPRSDSSDIFSWLQLGVMVVVMLSFVLIRGTSGGFEFAIAEGTLNRLEWSWRYEAKRDVQLINDALFSQASQNIGDGEKKPTSGQTEVEQHADEQANVAVPAPPGITELVLESTSEDAFKEMREHLSNARQFHRVVLWVLFGAFLAFLGVCLYKLLLSPKTATDWAQAIGSAGIGGGLLWFAEKALRNNRISQVSLALFESYVAEAREALKDIQPVSDIEERRIRRGNVWQGFRLGLNEIWLSERHAAEGRSQSESAKAKKTTASKEQL